MLALARSILTRSSLRNLLLLRSTVPSLLNHKSSSSSSPSVEHDDDDDDVDSDLDTKTSSNAWRNKVNKIGQPQQNTHEHLFKHENESARDLRNRNASYLTPGISRAEYKRRRRKLLELLPENSVAILCSANVSHYANTVIPYQMYRQDADFAYLTGCLQAHAAMILVKNKNGNNNNDSSSFYLFTREFDRRDEVWNGPRAHPEIAGKYFDADESFAIENLEDVLRKLVSDQSVKIFIDKERFVGDKLAAQALKALAMRECRVLKAKTQSLRWKKSDDEFKLLQRSAEANLEGILEAIKISRGSNKNKSSSSSSSSSSSFVDITERDLMNAHEYKVKSLGADRLAFPTVMGASNRATIVHYHQNDRMIYPNDLCLMDAGCEINGYVSDITRVWAGGSENAEFKNDYQKACYDAVAHVRNVVIQKLERDVASGTSVSLNDLHLACVAATAEALADLLPNETKNSLVANNKYQKFFPHAVSHWLGMDTHDTPLISSTTPIEPGNCFSVEPGLYFDVDDISVPKNLRGVGVRLEDEVCVDNRSIVKVLSDRIPCDRVDFDRFLASTH